VGSGPGLARESAREPGRERAWAPDVESARVRVSAAEMVRLRRCRRCDRRRRHRCRCRCRRCPSPGAARASRSLGLHRRRRGPRSRAFETASHCCASSLRDASWVRRPSPRRPGSAWPRQSVSRPRSSSFRAGRRPSRWRADASSRPSCFWPSAPFPRPLRLRAPGPGRPTHRRARPSRRATRPAAHAWQPPMPRDDDPERTHAWRRANRLESTPGARSAIAAKRPLRYPGLRGREVTPLTGRERCDGSLWRRACGVGRRAGCFLLR
jgi:hypothetical protein